MTLKKTQTEINSVNTQVKNGVTLRKKRELEEKLESLEKEKNMIRSKIRLAMVS